MSQRLTACWIGVFALVCVHAAHAQTLDRTQEVLGGAAQQQGTVLDLKQVQPTEAQRQQTRDALTRAGIAQPPSPLPKVETPVQAPIDIAALARRLSAQASVPASATEKPAGPIVFVSLSMPESSLMALAKDAIKVNAVLVLRGMVGGSLRKTAKALQTYSRLGVNLVIDPQAFTRHNVQVVPAFAIDLSTESGRSCQTQQACQADYSVLIEGDVSIAHALRAIETRSSGRMQAVARQWIKDLES